MNKLYICEKIYHSMSKVDIEYVRYPVGKFTKPDVVIPEQIKVWIQEIKDLPGLLLKELIGLSPEDYNKTYRPGGWNIRQVIHHLADSHMNSFIRFKLALTELNPVIKPYLEDLWSAMPDETMLEPQFSLDLLGGLHTRWGFMLDQMTPADFQRGFIHPEKNRLITLEETTALYAWHCRHHLMHIRIAKQS